MKLVVTVIHNRDKNKVTDELIRAGFKFTVIGSSGGFLREGNTTMLVGVADEDLPLLKSVLQENCPSREQMVNVTGFEGAGPGAFMPTAVKVPVGGAVAFVMNVDEFCRF